jgi:hypothetical protein
MAAICANRSSLGGERRTGNHPIETVKPFAGAIGRDAAVSKRVERELG